MPRLSRESAYRLWARLKERADRRTLKRWGAYILYAALLGALLLYSQFPTDKLKARIVAEFEARLPAHLVIDKAHVVFGPAVRLEGVEVRGIEAASSRTYVEAERIVLRPTWGTLLGRSLDIGYEMTVNGGSATGRLRVPAGRHDLEVSADMQGISVKRGTLLKGICGLEMSGTMTGKLEARLGDELKKSTGRLQVEVSGGKLQGIENDALPIGTIKFRQLKFEGDLGGGKLTMRRADLTPGDVTNKLSGVIELGESLSESRMALRGTLSLSEYLAKAVEEDSPAKRQGGLNYVVTGSLAAPKFSLDLGNGNGQAAEGGQEGDAGDEESPPPAPAARPRPALRPNYGPPAYPAGPPGATPRPGLGPLPRPMPGRPLPPGGAAPRGPVGVGG